MARQCTLDVQHHLLGFRLQASWHELPMRILASLTGKKKQIPNPCRFRKTDRIMQLYRARRTMIKLPL
jgi:hypothetical protein